MTKKIIILSLFALPLPLAGENGGSFLFAQRPAHSSMAVRGGVSNAVPVPFQASADISLSTVPSAPVNWGLDTAWDNEDNVVRGTNYIGKDVLSIGRVSFQPSDLVDASGNLSAAQQAALQSRLNHIAVSGVRSVILNSDHEALNKTNYVGKPEQWYKVIKASVKYIQSKGFTVITVSPFNEPDHAQWGQGSKADFLAIARLISEDKEMTGIRISAGNTLNSDYAMTWYSYMKPYVTEGNTHQLAGSFNTYASFFQKVRSDGNHATGDELHNVGDALVAAHYGMQSGVWWGWDGAARGEFCRASFYGKEIGYGENRTAWTAATVYKRNDGRMDGFIGTSERQAYTSSFDFVSTDRPVYFDGYGPVNNYTVTIKGGTGYQTGQTNAERMVLIHSGEDVPLDELKAGNYVIMNVNSNMALGFYNGAKGDALNITQMSYSNAAPATHQQWTIEPISTTSQGDVGYFLLRSVRDNTQLMDIKDWSTSAGGLVIGYAGGAGTNEQWFTEYAGDGNWYIRSRHSGLYLEIKAASMYKNAYLQQAAFTGEANQKWRFIPGKAKLEQTAPAAPQELAAEAQSASVRLTWKANSDSDLAGYVVLRALASANPDDKQSWDMIGRMVSGTEFVDNTARPGVEYVYKVKAVDKTRNQSAASVTVKAVQGGVEAPCSLVARYAFDDNAEDATENVNDAAVYGTATYAADGAKEGAASVMLGGSAYLQLPTGVDASRDMTISMWAKFGGSTTAWQRLFDFGNGTEQYFFLTPDNGSEMRVVLKDGAAEQILSASKPASGWHHVAVTLAADAVTLYVDGEVAASGSDIIIRPADFNPVRNYIGRSQFATDPLFNGNVDDLRIYSAALSAEAVKQVMNGDEPTAVKPLPASEREATGKTFTLGGQQVDGDDAKRGVYILDGRKYAR